LDFSLFFQKNWNSAMFFQTGLCHFFKGNWGKLIFENTLSLIQNLLPFKKNFFLNLDSANFEKNRKNFPSETLCSCSEFAALQKGFFSKLFLDSAVFSEKNWEKLFFENTMFLFRICCSSKKFSFNKTFFQSGLCRFFREKLRKTFLRKHYVLVQNLLLFKKVFFQ
jgi:hypothetical protein